MRSLAAVFRRRVDLVAQPRRTIAWVSFAVRYNALSRVDRPACAYTPSGVRRSVRHAFGLLDLLNARGFAARSAPGASSHVRSVRSTILVRSGCTFCSRPTLEHLKRVNESNGPCTNGQSVRRRLPRPPTSLTQDRPPLRSPSAYTLKDVRSSASARQAHERQLVEHAV
ncbi:hypothetical protein EXIGLDRAFT_732741 [Exidia glandulosa HHB12029]|uniref:Uncharacterized protein n=1 Tax=Exidia glandulosa HHB12029 TaxID=1314781 RepID=A0A165BEX0_EXIGL|nr:hypothetical protein EXIGLDRAFT_732741 [Exidia glandulosa HHB12029]